MKMKKLSVLLLMALILMPMVLAQSACEEIVGKIQLVITLLTAVAGGVAVIAAIVVGIMFMNASDPSDKDRLGGRLKALVIGIVIVAVANPLVTYLLGSIMNCP